MQARARLFRWVVAVSVPSLAFAACNAARAADLYWDADGATTGATGGTGTWDTSTPLWRDGSATGQLVAYPAANPSTAVAQFGGTAGTVTLSGTLNAAGITFSQSGYLLTGGTLNLAPSAGPFVYTTSGGTNSINSVITSAGGVSVTKTGAGTLSINTGGGGSGTSPNFYTVTGGTLNSSTGIFDSVLAVPAGNRLGVQATSPTTVLTLDAGTFQVTSATGNALATNRTVQVNAAGGSIADFGSNNFYQPSIVNNAGAASSLYLSNISGTTQFQGVISGTGSVTWMGAGTASLQAANTYAGTTTVNGGVIAVTANGALGTTAGNTVVNNGATLDLQNVAYTTAEPVTLINGTLAVSTGTSSFAGDITNGSGSGAVTDTVNVAGTALTLSGGIFGSAGQILNKTGAGTLTLSGTGDNAGGRIQVSAGTVVLAKTSNGGVHSVGSFGGTDYALIVNGGTAQLGGTGGDQIYFASAVQINGGTFDLNALSEGFDGLSGAGGTILNNNNTATSTLTLGQNNSSASPTFTGTLANGTGTLALVKTGAGSQTLGAANTYTGGTTVNGGTLSLGTSGTLGATTGPLTVSNPNTGAGTAVVLNLATAADTTVGTLTGTVATPSSGTNTATINIASGHTLTVNQTAAGTYAGTLAGSGAFTLGASSTNTLTLTGANSYTGGTTISAGTLLANGTDATNGSTGSGTVSVNNGGTLAGTGVVKGSVSVNSGAKVSGGDAVSTPGKLTTGGQTWAGGGMYLVNMAGATGAAGTSAGYSQLSMSTLSVTATGGNTFTVSLSGSPSDFNAANTYTWTVAVVSGSVPGSTTGLVLNTSNFHPASTPTGTFSLSFASDPNASGASDLNVTYSQSAPEPATFAFALTAAVPLLGARPRRRNKAEAPRR